MSAAEADILRRARARISDPARWTRGTLAKDTHGRAVPASNPSAVRWCALGAILAENDGPDDSAYRLPAARYLAAAVGIDGRYLATEWNDALGHSAIIQGFDRAIELAEADA
jgi:hypothetical protein